MKISKHASERFAQRALNFRWKLTEVERVKINLLIRSECKLFALFTGGEFVLKSYGVKAIMKNGVIITVIPI